MALPAALSKTSPADSDNPSQGAAQIRALKTWMEDVFGISDAISYTTQALSISPTTGVVTISQDGFLPSKIGRDLLFNADGTYDIGDAAGSYRPRNLYISGNLVTPGAILPAGGVIPLTYTIATRPAASGSGKLITVSDDIRGLYRDSEGSDWVHLGGRTFNVLDYGVVADDPGDGTGTDNSAALVALSAILTNGSRVYIPPAPAGKYYRLSGATATQAPENQVWGLDVTSLTDIEIFGAGPASRFYLSDWDNTNFDITGGTPYYSSGLFGAIRINGSSRVSVHDLAFYGEYGTTEKFPAAGYFINSSGIKVINSHDVTIRNVQGYNIVGQTVTVHGTLGVNTSYTNISIYDSYAYNNAANGFNYMGGGRYGTFQGNRSVNSQNMLESACMYLVINGNHAHWTSDYAHVRLSDDAYSGYGIVSDGDFSAITGNVISSEGHTYSTGISVSSVLESYPTIDGFSDSAQWTLGGGATAWTMVGGVATKTAGNAGDLTSLQAVLIPNQLYRLYVTAAITSGTVTAYLGGTTQALAAGANAFFLSAGITNTTLKFQADAAFAGTLTYSATYRTLAVMQSGKHTTVSGNVIQQAWYRGIVVNSISDGVAIIGNTLENLSTAPADNGIGIRVVGEAAHTVANVIVQGNVIQAPNLSVGIYLDYVDGLRLLGNVVKTSSYAIQRGTNTATNVAMHDNYLESSAANEFFDGGAGIAGWSVSRNVGTGTATAIGQTLSTTWNPANIATGASTTAIINTSPMILGQSVNRVWFNQDLKGCSLSAYVSGVNTVTIVLTNNTGGDQNVDSGTVYVEVGQ